jgi:hypothetical protein
VSGAALVEDRGGYDPVAEHVAQAVETLTTGRVNGLRSIAKSGAGVSPPDLRFVS